MLTVDQIKEEFGISLQNAQFCAAWQAQQIDILARHPIAWWERECGCSFAVIQQRLTGEMAFLIKNIWRMPVVEVSS